MPLESSAGPSTIPEKISGNHPLAPACSAAYEKTSGEAPARYGFWHFGTNAAVSAAMGVPAAAFGPGECKPEHMTGGRCAPAKAEEACRFCTHLIGTL